MNTIVPRPVSPLFVAGVFTASFIALTVLVNIIVLLVPFDNPAMGLIIVFAAAGAAAHTWFAREKAVPSNGRAWIYALICGIVAGVLSAALAVAGLSGDTQLWREFSSAGTLELISVFAGIVAALTLSARLGFWLTFRQVAKPSASS